MGGDLERRIVRLRQGDHLCLIYDHVAEQTAALLPFLKRGLGAAERCLYLAGGATTGRIERALSAAGIDVARERERGALVLLACRDAYLRDGGFDPGAMTDLLRQAEQEALDDGWNGLRVAGEMSWCLGGAPGGERFLEFEALLNRFLAGSRSIALCQYDRSRSTPEVLHGVLRTHPFAVLGGELCPNVFYEPPEMVLGSVTLAERVEWMIARLRQAQANERKLEDLSRRLVEQRGALERADSARAEFLGSLANELRNPLGAISNAIQVLRIVDQKGDGGDETRRRAIDAAERQIHHQALLVDDLLEAPRAAAAPTEPQRDPLSSANPARRRILVVEDNPDTAATMRDFLELSGHEVELASSGTDGVQAARQFHPEVVLCDLGLPGMDGFEVAAELRRDPTTASARLIAVTGYGREEDRRRSKAAGFDLHLTKPVDPSLLRRVLRQSPRHHH